MVSFDSILGWAIPTIVIIVFGYLFLKPFFEPFSRIIGWIKGIGKKKEETIQSIQYE